MKEIIKKILYPNKFLGFLLFNVSMISLIYFFINGLEESIIAIISYPIAFYSLVIFCTWLYHIIIRTNKLINQNKLYIKYKSNQNIKIKSSLYFNIFMNTIYAVFNLISGIYYSSYWLITFAIYYITLSTMRIILLSNIDNEIEIKKEYQILKNCGVTLLFMNILFSGIVTLIIRQNKYFNYPGFLIYAVAAYDFYLITYAIINIIRYRKNNRPIFIASKCISLTTAMISLISLETAMLSQFGTGKTDNFNLIMVASTGLGICIINSVMAIYMIIKGNKNK